MFHSFVFLKSQLRVKDSIGLLTISDRNPLDNGGDLTSESRPPGSGRRNPGTGPEPQTRYARSGRPEGPPWTEGSVRLLRGEVLNPFGSSSGVPFFRGYWSFIVPSWQQLAVSSDQNVFLFLKNL